MPRRRRQQSANGGSEFGTSPRQVVIEQMRAHGFDGEVFAENLETSTYQRKRRGKPARLNRYFHYCSWAHALMEKNIGPAGAEYTFPSSVLAFIRDLVPGNVKGEFREHAYLVSMQEFCEAMELPSY
ncbi:hypothetical protein AC249_AIPGENE10828 [Exaiptasia diaphana]|nr:hypothetical protein AC249_AIPGENE10828 [Exaiptasia diaphana]